MPELLSRIRAMQRLNEESSMAFVFATHDPRVVAYARRVIEMRAGKIENGNTKTL